MITLTLSLVLLGCITNTYGQGPRIQSPIDIGIFNDRLVGIDDISLPDYANLRSFLGITKLPVANAIIPGRRGVLSSGVAPIGVPVIAPITVGKLRRCQKKVCPKQKVPSNCRYTPVLQDLSGEYCRGCDQNVCTDLNIRGVGRNNIDGRGRNSLTGRDNDRSDRKEERKQMRKLRRRICRSTGVCLGDSGQKVAQAQLRRSMLGDARVRGTISGNMFGNMGGNLAGALGLFTNQRPGMINPGPVIGSGLIENIMGQPQLPFIGQSQIPIIGQSQIPIVGQSQIPIVRQPGIPIIGQAQPVITG